VNLGTVGRLNVLLGLASGEFVKGLDQAQSKLDGFSSWAKNTGRTLTAFVTAPLAALGVFATNEASSLQEATSAATKTYGAGADFIIGKSRDARSEVFLSQQQYLSAATTLGVFGQAAGVSGTALGQFGDDMIGASADIASFYNVAGGTPEVLEAIRAGLAGETEPLRRFGIFMTEAAIQAYALENGLWDGVGAMTESQKIMARHGFILDNLGAAEGDAAETAGELANQQRQVGAGFRNVAAVIGRTFLPIANRAFGWMNDWLDKLEDISPTMQKWAVIIGVGAAALGPLLIAIGYLLPGLTAIGTAFAVLLSPIGLVAVALGGLAFLFRGEIADAIGVAVGAFGDLADGVSGFFDTLQTLGFDEAIGVLAATIEGTLGEGLTSAIVNALQVGRAVWTGEWDDLWRNLGELAVDLGTIAIDGALALGGALLTAAQGFGGWLWGQIDALWDNRAEIGAWTLDVVEGAIEFAGDVASWIGDKLASLAPAVDDFVGWALSLDGPMMWVLPGAAEFGGWIGDKLRTVGAAVEDFVNWALALGVPAVMTGLDAVAVAIGSGIAAAIGESLAFGVGIASAVGAKLNLQSVTAADLFEFGSSAGDALRNAIIDGVEALAAVDWAGIGDAVAGAIADITWQDAFNVVALPAKIFGGIATALGGFTLGLILGEDKANEIGRQIGNTIASAIIGIADFASGIFGAVTDALSAGVGAIDWGSIPADVAQSLWDAIKAAFGAIADIGDLIGQIPIGNPLNKASGVAGPGGVGGRDRELAGSMQDNPFAALIGFAQDAATKVTAATLAIESRVTAMAGVLTVMGDHAGAGFRNALAVGVQSAAALTTNATLAMESRLQGFASAATIWGLHAASGFENTVRTGWADAAAFVAVSTLATESRLMGFAGAATVAGFNAGDGFASGTAQGFSRAQGSANDAAGAIRGALSIDLYGAGRRAGDSFAAGLDASLGAAVYRARAAANQIYAELARAVENSSAFGGTGV
jgi:hypothetical protein